MRKIIFLPTGSTLLLSGYVGVKSSSDCDTTTSNIRIAMTEVSQLAWDKAARQMGKPAAGGLPSLVSSPATSAVGILSASRSVVSPPSGTRTVNVTPPVSTGMSAGINTNTITLTPTPHPVAETLATTTPSLVAYRLAASVVILAPSYQNVRCDNPGSVHPQRSQDQMATARVTSWVNGDNTPHQPGRVSSMVSPANWVLPARVD